jgi:glycosyltransferase involved in cell wall biosynthesis
MMQISLIVCTRNRASQLAGTLETINRLACSYKWELIVVNNGSTDDTKATIEQYRTSCPTEVTIIDEPLPGLGRARNTGWKASLGDIIAFTDDDCYPDEHLLDRMIECFREDDRLGFIGGQVLLHDPTDYRITILDRKQREDIPPHSFIPAGQIAGANFAFRRAAIEAVKGFDEIFGPGALFICDDVDIVARISETGWFGAYDPRPIVYHHHRRKTVSDAFQLMKQYDRGRGAYYAKCLVNFSDRALYMKNWYRRIRSQTRGTTFREFAAALEYLARICVSKFSFTIPLFK